MTLAIVLAGLAGVALGLLGGGGSMLTTPILLYAAHLPGKEAIATSLVVVGATAAFGALQHARHGAVRWRTGLAFGAASMLGAYGGGHLAGFVPARVLLGLFAVFMAVTGVRMLRPAGPATPQVHPLRLVAIGLGAGAVTGLVGAGGGFIVVPALVLAGGLPMRAAVGTSLFVIALQSVAGFAGHAAHVTIDWQLAVLVAGGALAGSVVGTRLARRLDPRHLRTGFAVLVLVMAAYVGLQQVGVSGLAALGLGVLVALLGLRLRPAAPPAPAAAPAPAHG